MRVGVADLGREALLHFHQREDLFLDARLLLLDLFDLRKHGGVLLVGLDLVEARFGLRALGGGHVEVLFLRADALLCRVEPGLRGLEGGARLVHGRVDRLDLLRQPGGLALEPGDTRVDDLEIDQELELSIHVSSVRVVGPPGLEPGPNRL